MDYIWTPDIHSFIKQENITFVNDTQLINMKFLQLTTSWILAGFLTACSGAPPIDDTFCWPSSGNDQADSLLLTYERAKAYLPGYRLLDPDSLTAAMHTLACTEPANKVIRIRAGWMTAEQVTDIDAKRRLVDSLVTQCDSTSMPYDFHVLQRLRAETSSDVYCQFLWLTDNLQFFSDNGAAIEVARNNTQIGRLLWLMHDHGRAMGYFDESIKLYRQKKLFSDLTFNYLLKSNVVGADKEIPLIMQLLKWIDRDSASISPSVRADILHNGAVLLDSLELMDRSIRLRKATPDSHSILPLSMMVYGNMLLLRGRPNEGHQIGMAALKVLDSCQIEERHDAAIHHILGVMYASQGMKDSALQELNRAYWSNIDYNKRYMNPDIYIQDTKTRIALAKNTARLEKNRIAMWWIVSSLILATIILYLYMQTVRRQEQHRHERYIMDARIENDRQSLLALAKIVDENERMITGLGNTISRLQQRGLIKEEGVDEVRKQMHIYRSNEQYRQGFLKISQELDSEFKGRLKADFPDLSEYRLQLSALIASGVDSRQIASILNTTYESVYKSRYRLRTRFGLSKENSLEDFLRKYNRRSPE